MFLEIAWALGRPRFAIQRSFFEEVALPASGSLLSLASLKAVRRLITHWLPEATGPQSPILGPWPGRCANQASMGYDLASVSPIVRSI